MGEDLQEDVVRQEVDGRGLLVLRGRSRAWGRIRPAGGACTMATVSPVMEEDEVEDPLAGSGRWEELGGRIRAGLGVLRVRMLRSESSLVAAFF